VAPATTHQLTDEQRQSLEASIRDFLAWLRTRVTTTSVGEDFDLSFPRPTPADWLMRVGRPNSNSVQFNTYILKDCTFAYYQTVVLHECFHLFVQDLPNKEDAKRLKDDFGDHVMKLLDIEADFYTALYLKERRQVSLVRIFELMHEGSTVFGDPKIRIVKLERFIGAVLSIAKLYLAHKQGRRITDSDIYLPNISNIPTEDSLHILIARKSHFVLSNIHADIKDFYELKQYYTNLGDFSRSGYVKRLIDFATKALGAKMPDYITREIEQFAKQDQRRPAADLPPIPAKRTRSAAARKLVAIRGA
jgi:hypothetical protein